MSKLKYAIIIQDVISCARCGDNHGLVSFKPFTRPNNEWTHWATCPNVYEPIMMKIEEQETKEN